MKYLCSLAWKFIKEGKAYTKIVALGTILCVFSITCMLMYVQSYDQFQKMQMIYASSDYEFYIQDETGFEALDKKIPVKHRAERIILQHYGYGVVDDTYIELAALDHFTTKQPLSLRDGAYPSNENEIIISKEFSDQVGIGIGDQITINQQLANQDTKENKEYQVCGIYWNKEFYFKQYASDMMITQSNRKDLSMIYGFYSVKGLSYDEIVEVMDGLYLDDHAYPNHTGTEILYGIYESPATPYYTLYFIILLVVLIPIMIHLFHMSAISKRKYLGMIKSVGATKSQLFQLSLCESILLAIIMVPIGVALAMAVMYVALPLLTKIEPVDVAPFSYPFVVDITAISLVIGVNLIFVFFCNMIANLGIHRYSVIQLLKGNETVRKILSSTSITEKLFGIEGKLALCNIKRNRSSNLTLIFSISVAIMIVIIGKYYTSTIFGQYGLYDSLFILMIGMSIIICIITILELYMIVSANMMIRKHEYASLMTMGLTKKQLKKMTFIEYGGNVLIAVILGTCLSQFIKYEIYTHLGNPYSVWDLEIGLTISVVVIVLLVSFITIHLAYKKISRIHLIDAIKDI